MRWGIAVAATALFALSCEVVAEQGADLPPDCVAAGGVCWGGGECPGGMEAGGDCAGAELCCLFVEEAPAAEDCASGPSARYVGQSSEVCDAIAYLCEPGERAFFDDCGCGCVRP